MVLAVVFLLAGVFILSIILSTYKQRLTQATNSIIEKDQKLDTLHKDKDILQTSINNLEKEKIELTVRAETEKKHLTDTIEELKRIKEEMTNTFKSISADVIRTQHEEFDKKQKANLESIVNPLGTQITEFRSRMEIITKGNIEDKSKLEVQLNNLLSMNQALSEEAQNLTNALKGNSKIQGDWGEVQLEQVLDITGLEKGINYDVQENIKNEETGVNLRPDIIIKLPGGRKIIVDSKVSLNAYVEYMKEDDKDKKAELLSAHVAAIKNHIKGLSSKEYQKHLKTQSLDYVLLFIPIEHAYIEVLHSDSNIYTLAYSNGVAICTPSSLIPILRTIENLWQIEKRHKNVEIIADLGSKLYDKLSGFVDDMKKIEANIDKAKSAYTDAFGKLKTGKGNAIGIAERLKLLGATTTKELHVEYESEEQSLLVQDAAPTKEN